MIHNKQQMLCLFLKGPANYYSTKRLLQDSNDMAHLEHSLGTGIHDALGPLL